MQVSNNFEQIEIIRTNEFRINKKKVTSFDNIAALSHILIASCEQQKNFREIVIVIYIILIVRLNKLPIKIIAF